MEEKPDELSLEKLIEREDNRFYDSFDPFYFWTLAQSFNPVLDGHIRVKYLDEETASQSHPLALQLKKSQESLKNYNALVARAFRYFSAETLLLFLVSGDKFGPFARAASLPSRRVAELVREIADGKVPQKYRLFQDGRALSFKEWVAYQCFASLTALDGEADENIVKLVLEEMQLLTERGAFNAFKHGKPKSFGEGFSLKLRGLEGSGDSMNEVLSGLNWTNWEEKKAGLSIAFHTEELDLGEDMKRLFSTGLLLNAIVQARRMKAGIIPVGEVHLPSNLQIGNGVRRQKLEIKISKEAT